MKILFICSSFLPVCVIILSDNFLVITNNDTFCRFPISFEIPRVTDIISNDIGNLQKCIIVCDCCLMPNEQFFSYMYIMARVSYIRWDDVRFVLDQHDKLDFYSESSPKQLSEGRHVSPL
jgi:hypothetical protein